MMDLHDLVTNCEKVLQVAGTEEVVIITVATLRALVTATDKYAEYLDIMDEGTY